jgi:hypothetical protein
MHPSEHRCAGSQTQSAPLAPGKVHAASPLIAAQT